MTRKLNLFLALTEHFQVIVIFSCYHDIKTTSQLTYHNKLVCWYNQNVYVVIRKIQSKPNNTLLAV